MYSSPSSLKPSLKYESTSNRCGALAVVMRILTHLRFDLLAFHYQFSLNINILFIALNSCRVRQA